MLGWLQAWYPRTNVPSVEAALDKMSVLKPGLAVKDQYGQSYQISNISLPQEFSSVDEAGLYSAEVTVVFNDVPDSLGTRLELSDYLANHLIGDREWSISTTNSDGSHSYFEIYVNTDLDHWDERYVYSTDETFLSFDLYLQQLQR